VLGGVPKRGIYDNMKTAVDKIKKGKAGTSTRASSVLVNHYLFDAEFCNPAVGLGEGPASRRMCRIPATGCGTTRRTFKTLDDLNDWLEAPLRRAVVIELTIPRQRAPHRGRIVGKSARPDAHTGAL
jgi:transposase